MTAEERMTKLEEQMLVQAELVARFERRTEAWMAQAEERMTQHDDGIVELRATLVQVLRAIDRFIAGQEGNGRGHGGAR